MAPLEDYNRKRIFAQTPEPKGEKGTGSGPLRFVVQMHHASRLHYDFRIEVDGVLKSWAVPKGPSLNPQDQRLAVYVEDHPIAYGSFEGIIPKGNYGAGTVMVWDEGTYVERGSQGREDSEKAVLKGLEKGHITIVLEGIKLQGEFALIRLKDKDEKSWLLVKKRDSYSSYKDITDEDRSVKTGRSIQEIAAEAPEQGAVWVPAQSRKLEPSKRPATKKGMTVPKASHPKSFAKELKKEKIPRRNKPMLPASAKEAFDQDGWTFEFDYGGYRAISEVEKGVAHLYSKQLLPFEKKFPEIVQNLKKIPNTAVFDGEVVAEKNQAPVYWVRDLLHLDGMNLRSLALIERKKYLKNLNIFNETIRLIPDVPNEGKKLFDQALHQGFPGIIARDLYSPYTVGTSKSWLKIAGKPEDLAPRLTHLDKIYFPKDQITKGDVIEYYRQISQILLPYLKDRPESLFRQPNGIQEGFFQKDLVGHHPRWVHTHRIYSESVDKSIDYLLCQNESSLLYMANLGCIELNPWLSRIDSLDRPDFVVIDLDPDSNDFSEVVQVALGVHQILTDIEALHLCKTSGASGIHIFIPIQAKYDYETARHFAQAVCQVVHRQFPDQTSLERSPAKRKGKIYLDCLQNVQGQTVASVYCIRPKLGAPVSTPMKWEELTSSLRPEQFNIRNTLDRLEKSGDLWRPVLEESVNLQECLLRLTQKYPIKRYD